MRAQGRITLAIVLMLAPLSGCDGGRGGSSGLDIGTENAAISQALMRRQCLDFQALRICPADESAGQTPLPTGSPTATPVDVPSVNTSLRDATAIDCFQATPGGSCTFSVTFVPRAFPSGTTFQVLAREGESGSPWVLGADPVPGGGSEASSFTATLALASAQGGPPAQAQVAILAFAGASPGSGTEVQQLHQTAATYAFVTEVLAVDVVTPTLTPAPTARPTNTPTPTRTPGANDCCQCPLSCAAPVNGTCGDCTVVFGTACYGELLCAVRTPTPTPTPEPPSPTPVPCLKDNGDGTISDLCTGLMWEKKDQAGGLHDWSSVYPWTGNCLDPPGFPCQPDAEAAATCTEATNGAGGCSQCPVCMLNNDPVGPTTTIWGWLAQLNQGEGFAGHTDWRIPTVEKDGDIGELETIFLPTCPFDVPCVSPEFNTNCPRVFCDQSHPCSSGQTCPFTVHGADQTCESGCTVTSCSCTQFGSSYWSATSAPSSPSDPIPGRSVWSVNFGGGGVFSTGKAFNRYVRAVRGVRTPHPTSTPGANDCCECPSSCAAPVDGTCGDCTVVFDAACDGALCGPQRATPTPTPCLKDNGDGTVTDACTGLIWEKQDQAGGLNDYAKLYTWAGACSGNTSLCQPNAGAAAACAAQTGDAVGCGECARGTCVVDPNHGGATTTIWDWIEQLNASTFGGYDDWRIPNVGFDGGSPELETLFAAPSPCTGLSRPCVLAPFNTNCVSGCSATNCSCTRSDAYWTATTNISQPGAAWEASFDDAGFGQGAPKTNSFSVRAVRGGL
jgi:Protein of unknown function (DUF1566)